MSRLNLVKKLIEGNTEKDISYDYRDKVISPPIITTLYALTHPGMGQEGFYEDGEMVFCWLKDSIIQSNNVMCRAPSCPGRRTMIKKTIIKSALQEDIEFTFTEVIAPEIEDLR